MFSIIVLICYGIDRVISGYKTRQTKKEQQEALVCGKEEPTWNPSFA